MKPPSPPSLCCLPQMAWRRHILKGRVAVRLAERRMAEAAQQAVVEAKQQEEETFEVPPPGLMLALLAAAAAGCSCL